jgi:hypothetical protein
MLAPAGAATPVTTAAAPPAPPAQPPPPTSARHHADVTVTTPLAGAAASTSVGMPTTMMPIILMPTNTTTSDNVTTTGSRIVVNITINSNADTVIGSTINITMSADSAPYSSWPARPLAARLSHDAGARMRGAFAARPGAFHGETHSDAVHREEVCDSNCIA